MNRNGLVFVPREPPKRVILYPLQGSTSHQQQQLDGIYMRTKTDLLINQHNDTLSQSTNNNNRPSRQQTASHSLHNTDATAPSASRHTTAFSAGQRVQNPFYANPFFRPRVITNQQSTITNSLRPTSPTSSTTTTTTTTTDITAPANEPSLSTVGTLVSKGRQPFYPRIQSPLLFSNGKSPDPTGTTVISSLTQQESRPWAQSAISTHIVRYNGANERLNGSLKNPEVNTINSDTLKQKVSSATDIVISLMDTSGGAENPGSIPTDHQPVRTNGANNELLSNGHLLSSTEQLPSAPPVSLMEISSTANNNNQNWKKALLANFQKNYRNIPAAKLSYTRQPTASSSQSTISSVNETVNLQQYQQQQQQMSEGSTVLNAAVVERPLQTSDNPFIVPSTPRRSSESLIVPKPENNLMERSSSLQIPKPPLLSTSSTATTVNVTPKTEETSNAHRMPHLPMSIPSALLMSKPAPPPTTNTEQQRANITRVMIRRDFVQPLETKPPMPSASNIRSLMTSQPTKSDPISTNNVIRVATIADNPNRISQSHQLPPAGPRTQKSLLSFTTSSSAVKESLRADNNQQKSNGTNLSSTMTTRLSHTGITNGDMSSNESRRRREEVNIRSKRRAASASTTSNYEMTDKDPFEMEDEEYEAEIEEESLRGSESDVDGESTVTLDPILLLSDKTRRVGNTEIKSGLIRSLFENVPPTIRFCTETQRIEPLPAPLQKMMKWKMSAITPNIVKSTVLRSGFRLIGGDEGVDWLGTWSRHMKPPCFKAIREYQKINHFPGSFQIGRKDRLWRNLSHMQAVHSRREFDFVPQTFVLPADFLLFKRVFEETADSKESKWIIKPPASARGQGIRVISKMDQVPKKRPVVVQRYIANPYLINGHKFDMRLYVYVPSHDPLRIYLFDDGLARFASRKYSSSVKSLSDRFMHLTNYSVNRYNSEYRTNNDSAACTGHKWSLKALWAYLKKRDVDVVDVIEKIKDLVIKTIISADAFVNVLTKANVRRKFSVHELFGFDVILDENCKPYIVEVNISPSLHSNSPLDISVKGAMICDLLNLSGFMIPDRRDIISDGPVRRKAKLPKSLIFDRRVLPQGLSTDEKVKHQYFSQRYNDEQARKNILDVLTPDDLRILIETEDEFARRGSFERIFPTNQTRKYLKYFETPRYYNLLLNEWITKYTRNEDRGIALLNSFCKKEIHLQHPAVDPNHMWTQYQKNQGHSSYRENDNSNTNGT